MNFAVLGTFFNPTLVIKTIFLYHYALIKGGGNVYEIHLFYEKMLGDIDYLFYN